MCFLPSDFVAFDFLPSLLFTDILLTSYTYTYQDVPNGLISNGDSLAVQVVAMRGAATSVPKVANTSLVLYDATPPTVGQVKDAMPCGCILPNRAFATVNFTEGGRFSCDSRLVSYIPMVSCVRATWVGFDDGEVPVGVTYSVCVGSSPFECDVIPMEHNLTDQTSLTLHLGRETVHNETLCVSVEATNANGLRSGRASSPCVRVDATPPNITHVGVGVDPDSHQPSQTSTEVFFGNGRAQDDVSDIAGFDFCLTTNTSGEGPMQCDPSFHELLLLSNSSQRKYSSAERKATSTTDLVVGESVMYAGVEFHSSEVYYMCARACSVVAYCSTYICSQNISIGKTEVMLGGGGGDGGGSGRRLSAANASDSSEEKEGVVDASFGDIDASFAGTATTGNNNSDGGALGMDDQVVSVGAQGQVALSFAKVATSTGRRLQADSTPSLHTTTYGSFELTITDASAEVDWKVQYAQPDALLSADDAAQTDTSGLKERLVPVLLLPQGGLVHDTCSSSSRSTSITSGEYGVKVCASYFLLAYSPLAVSLLPTPY